MAFPDPLRARSACDDRTKGMTLRDYFAGHSMMGFCANPEFKNAQESEIAKWAYEQADAMMKVRGM